MTTAERERVAPSPGPVAKGGGGQLSALLGRLAPAHRDGLALVLSSALTSAVGLLYWVVAARLFAPEELGVNSVALNTMMLLGSIAQLNLTYALLRFVPVAGRAARRLVLGGYLVGAFAAALVGGVFALGARLWAPELIEAFGHGPLLAFFLLATPLQSVFVMQDFVLTGIRKATVVPAENFTFSLLKIGLLAVAAVAVVPGGIAISWVASIAVIVVAINAWLLLRALPAHGRATADRALPITLGAVARFVRADYAGAVFWQTAMFGLPVFVLARLGPEEAAAYTIVWTMVQALYNVSSGMGQSMVAHSATDVGGIEEARRAMAKRALTLVVPVVAVLVVAAPLVLSVFGEHYAETGTVALVLAALSAIPNVITASTVSAARVRQRMGVLFGVPATVALIVLVVSWLLMPIFGIAAVGFAWLLGQVVVAGGILIATAPWLPPLLGTRIDAVRSAALLRRVLPLAEAHAGAGDAQWVLGERMAGRSDSVVVGFGPLGGVGALLKASDSTKGRAQLRRQTEVLRMMHADERIGPWRALVPSIVGQGDIGGSYCVLESRLDGEGGGRALVDPARRRAFRSSAITTISELHRCTSAPVRVGDAQLDVWVRRPMAEVVAALPRGQRAAARALEEEIVARIRGRRLASGWTHGDYTPDNVLTDQEGRVVAVVDWCHADEAGLPVLDLVCFLLTSENLTHGTELGALVLDRLADSRPTDHELLARSQRMLGGELLGVAELTLLGWLQHVGHNLEKSPHFAANPVWTRRNLVTVVREAPALLKTPTGQ
ncbi:phosphotransferase [Pseudonocardia nigra]|uniref:phosphotransferase n=1 Tax=Pseudonocardia nigra TaxID=1921578 RepID=UPI001C5FD5AE|nr:phosphotransferase [Pseudonocardia nigra]